MSRRPKSEPLPPPIPLDSLLTVQQVADRLQVAVSTVRAWIYFRRIDYVKCGSVVRIPEAALQAMVAKGYMPAIRS